MDVYGVSVDTQDTKSCSWDSAGVTPTVTVGPPRRRLRVCLDEPTEPRGLAYPALRLLRRLKATGDRPCSPRFPLPAGLAGTAAWGPGRGLMGGEGGTVEITEIRSFFDPMFVGHLLRAGSQADGRTHRPPRCSRPGSPRQRPSLHHRERWCHGGAGALRRAPRHCWSRTSAGPWGPAPRGEGHSVRTPTDSVAELSVWPSARASRVRGRWWEGAGV